MTNSPYEPRYATRAARMRASEIRELLKLLDQPDIISFAGGIPDPALFPADAAQAAYARALATPAAAGAALQYAVSEGYLPLRETIAADLAANGVPAGPHNILITSGSQQALEFLGRLLLSPGDTALVAAPTYLGALQAFAGAEPRYDTLAPYPANRTPESYAEAATAAGGAVKLAYLVPDFANPTGETLSLEARNAALDLADALDVPVIEDGAYAALRFEGEPIASLQALDVARKGSLEASRVIACGTFSKTIAPGLRVGWIVAGEAIIRRLVLVKQASDLHSATINQIVMHELARDGLARQIASARETYRARRDAMMAALARHMPAGVTWTQPEGGLFTWVTLPDRIDGAELLRRVVSEARVAFVPGGAFFAENARANTLRLSFSLAAPEKIDDGISRLARVARAM